MARLEIRPFSDEFVPAAGELLAARHRAHRAAEPLLPAQFEEPAAAQAEVEALLALEGISGSIALRDGRPVGYLLGAPRPNPIWGEHVWIELAGHAVEEPEDLRDLYGAAAARWVDEGHVRHYAIAPAHDPRAAPRLVARRLRPAARARHPGGARRGLARRRAPRRGARRRRAGRADPGSCPTTRLRRRPSPAACRPRIPDELRDRVSSKTSRSRRSAISSPSATAAIVGCLPARSRRALERPLGARAAGRRRAARLGGDGARGPRLGRRARAHRGRVRLGARARARGHGHRLARHEPALVALLAAARLPGDVPPPVPPHPVVPRVPIPSGSRVAVVNAARRRRAAAAPALRGRRRRRRGRSRRAPLPALRLAARGARLARRHRHARRRGAGAAAAGRARRPPPLRARRRDRRARAARRPDDAPDDPRRGRAQPAGRAPRARGAARTVVRPPLPRPRRGARRRVARPRPRRRRRTDAPAGAIRCCSRPTSSSASPPPRPSCTAVPARSSAPAGRRRCAPRRPTPCSRPPPRAAGSSASRSSERWPAASP